MDELRVVARYVLDSAEPLLSVFEEAVPGDERPRAALEAACRFAGGEQRTMLQRTTSLEAHRAAAAAPTEQARLGAQAAGDAASAAYLHPIRKAHQVGHLLRAAGNAARIAELDASEDLTAAARELEAAERRATPTLIAVLVRYPRAVPGRSRASALMCELDERLRRG